MKALKLTTAVALLCVNGLLLAICQAAEDGGKTSVAPAATSLNVRTKGKKSQVAQDTNTIVITGSYIPRKVKVTGRVTDGPGNVVVIDRGEIQRSGAATTAQVLSRVPGLSGGGR